VLAVCVVFVFGVSSSTGAGKVKTLEQLQSEFLQLKFGMFIHFGLTPSSNPQGLDCGQWIDAAQLAGMKYAILTTKHVDGFSLWDSAVTQHDVASSPYNKDVVKQFVDAVRKKGLKVGFYYSVWDRPHKRERGLMTPEKVQDIKTQITELLSNYGPIDYLWLDAYENIERANCKYPTVREVPWEDVYALAKKLQPNCLVMRHPGSQYDTEYSDIQIWERPFHRPKIMGCFERFLKEHAGRPQEICDTLQGSDWHWKSDLPPDGLKSVDYVLNALETCGKNKTNYLLNAGPNRHGTLDHNVMQRLKEIGTALKERSIKRAAGSSISRITGGAEPIFERWDEGGFHGTLDVAIDGTVLMFMVVGGEQGDGIYVKRSEDGGATWSDRQFIGKHVELDWKALGIGPYDGKGWGRDKGFRYASLGTSVVDENTGEIMFFMTALHPAPYMYKSRDHGKTWKLEKIELKEDSRGFLPSPNPACDPGITIKHGPHKGRLLAPSRVMVNYNKHEEAKGYTNAVYSDDHGKTWFSSEPFPIDGTGESGLVELSDGTIYLNSRTHTRKGNRWIAYSDDSGETWRDCHEDDELFDGPPDMYGCKAALLRLDRDDYDILLFSSPDPSLPERQNRANLNVWASFDGGKTWPVNRLIKEGPGNYSWMTQGRKGTPSEGFIYVRSIEGGMARFNMAWLLEPDDKKAGKYAFGDAAPAADNRASIGPSDDRFVLPPRNDYLMLQKPPLVKSAKNAQLFNISDDRLEGIETGYKLIDTKDKGHVLPYKICLPGNEMKISCDVSSGSITISLLDPAGNVIKTSKPVTGGLKFREPVQWPDGFKLDRYVATTVTVRFDLEGDAKLYAIRFDDLFWH
jgi:sialidase-1